MPAPIIAVQQPTDDDEQQPTSPIVRGQRDGEDNSGQPAQPAAPAPAPSNGYEAAALPSAPAMPNVPAAPPQMPVGYSPDTATLGTLQSKVQQDRQPVTVKPKWYDRLAGGLVGFGVGYKSGPMAGIEAGSAVTNRRQAQADQQRADQLRADEGAVQDFNAQNQMAQQDFDNNQRGYEMQVRQRELGDQENNAQWDRNFRIQETTRQQSNSDRDFNQRQTDADRSYERQLDEDQWAQGNADRNYGLESRRVGLEERDAQQRDAGTQATQLRQKMAANALDQRRQNAYKLLENGDGKGNEGYRQQLKDLQDTPVTKDYTKSDKDDDIADLNEQHVADKQKIEDDYAAQMQALGVPVQRVLYDSAGNPINNSDGSRAGAPPAAAPAQAPPAAAPTANLPKGGGKQLDVATAGQFLKAAGGDKVKARQLAAQNGWKF
ncbi:MAG TPA: hypothetical protein VME68_15420 [Acidobacteriaceae bacterium]|nr:hypothetical protein [Acidobacteriaceae bacterium]